MTTSPEFLHPPSRQTPAPPASAAGASAIPISLRVCSWVLLGSAGVIVASVLGLAEQLGARLLIAALPGPLFFGGMLLFVAWWHTRRLGRHLWSTPASFGRRWWSSPASSRPSSARPAAGGLAIDSREEA
jgi:hypothetical protein